MLSTSFPVFLLIGAAVCAPERMQSDSEQHSIHEANGIHDPYSVQSAHEDHVAALEKRSPQYDFGLGKRAYSYVSEYKRLPVYNFGLGKRSRPYSFGLGKRSVDEHQSNEEAYNEVDPDALRELFEHYDDPVYQTKRARPYSFGLGKRFAEDDTSEEKRARYGFGLGKRLPLYSFGLGKRLSSKFNFGLGKRERDMHRFSFGLGKRAADEASLEDFDSYIDA